MTNKYCKNREKFKVTQKYKFQYVYTFKSQTFKKNPIKIYIKAIKRNAPLYLFFLRQKYTSSEEVQGTKPDI